MARLLITDVTLRDAHQSLLATRMRTRDMLPIADLMDRIGFYSLEVWGGATFDVCIRFLNEDPWDRLRQLKKRMQRTPLQMLLRGQNLVGYRHYADDVVEHFVARAAENGVDIFRIFDALNDIRNMETSIRAVKRAGKHAQGAISYTVSPVHTIESFAVLAQQLERLGCDSICIKDMAGLISPQAVTELVRAIKQRVAIPVDLHSHCTSGMAPMSILAACLAGVDIVDTAISPLSGGSSHAPTESVVGALHGTPHDTGLDIDMLAEAAEYFEQLRDKYMGLLDPIAERVDTGVLAHQIPGGMISNLVSQLKSQNAMHRFPDVLKELPRVRAEMGFPPLVTPTSQIVGTQAVFNVVTGQRYKMVSQEVKDYFRGLYGQPPGPLDEDVRRSVIGDAELITRRPADLIPPQLDTAREKMRELGIPDHGEDVLTFALYGDVAAKFLKGQAKEEPIAPRRTSAENTPAALAGPRFFTVEVDGESFEVKVVPDGEREVLEQVQVVTKHPPVPLAKGAVTAPMHGVILKFRVSVGDHVRGGDVVAIMEAMKMQSNIVAHTEGVVKEIYVAEGQTLESGEVVLLVGGEE
ncbi:MAG: oxaloacetate decarboxylase subunit alpha [Chloroflexota bacterium]|nr:MAG: oxaloacetate decarboxylase subunit alpha [Chloroflexota bacterium]